MERPDFKSYKKTKKGEDEYVTDYILWYFKNDVSADVGTNRNLWPSPGARLKIALVILSKLATKKKRNKSVLSSIALIRSVIQEIDENRKEFGDDSEND